MKPYLLILLLFSNDFKVSTGYINLADYDIDAVVKRLGLTLASYQLVTNDSYILQLHRVAMSERIDVKQHLPVLLMHGLTGSSADFLVTGKSSLAYMLLKEGYDVWMGNTRSSPYSTHNITNSTALSSNSFWDYSWHEMGIYDVPLMIDRILEETGKKKTFYVGYSQGSTEFFVLTSMFPEYNDKIKLMVALAPAVYTGYVQLGPRLLSFVLTYPLMIVTKYFGHFNMLFTNSAIRMFTSMFCANSSLVIQAICVAVPYLIIGKVDPDNVFLSKYLLYSPSKGSSKQFLHYAQFVYNPTEFHFYDYGKKTNQLMYNSPYPPAYPLERVDTPIFIFYSNKDLMVPPKSVQVLKSNIKNCMGTFQIDNFGHLDFMYGKNHAVLYKNVVKVINQFRLLSNLSQEIIIN